MATIKKGKTLKLDAICAKLKSIGGDDTESLVTSTVCQPQISSKQSELGQLCAKLHSMRETEEPEEMTTNVSSLSENDVSKSEINGEENGIGENNNIELDIKRNTEDLRETEGDSSTTEQLPSGEITEKFSQNNDDCLKESNKPIDIVDSTSRVKEGHSNVGDGTLNVTPSISSQETLSGASRRKRRKAATPRNIAQVREFLDQLDSVDDKDGLAEYEINNQNTTFPPPDIENSFEEEDRTVSDSTEAKNIRPSPESSESENISIIASSIKKPTDIPRQMAKSKNSRKQAKPQIRSLPAVSVNMPLDLSLSRSDENDEDEDNFNYDDDDDENDEGDDYSREVEDLSIVREGDTHSSLDNSDSNFCPEYLSSSHASTPVPKSTQENQDISALQDYAENTMNELIQMYGFSGSSTESLNGRFDKLASNHILSHLGNSQNKDKLRYILPKGDLKVSPHLTNGNLVKGASESGPAQSTHPKTGIFVNYVSPTANRAKLTNEGPLAEIVGQQIPKITVPQLPTMPLLTDCNQQQTAGSKNGDKFTNSAAYIKAVFNQQVKGTSGSHKAILPDYSKYLKRFSSGQECQVKYCRDLGYREHFHCMDCNFRVFVKKEEMVRHFKWHRKREDSLQHGFLRFSPMDDCSQKFKTCTHNGRQTHYHCLQSGCDKVYISTSDVQMHANYHRKDSAIIQEGFQRFRATEDCGTPSCAFYGQRTTHFHCRRSTCNFTFKNKADMEKHKTYHQKDEILGKDGFKKFMKYEHCGYASCRYSKVSNHIHCIRSNCNYVLHSTAQLFSHKRKHERRDFENAYRKFREDQHDQSVSPAPGVMSGSLATNIVNPLSNIALLNTKMSLPVSIKQELSEDSESCDSSHFNENQNSLTLPLNIKREFEDDDSESVDSKRFKEDSDVMDDSNVSDMRSESSSSLRLEMSDQESIQDEASEEKTSDFFCNETSPKYSGETLSSSLNLPIPNLIAKHTAGVIVTSPQEAASALAQTALPVKASTSMPSTQVTTTTMSNPQITTIPLPARPPIMEKKEKDESWKNYLIRYTANDPCNSRCQYLYKDHYHCKVDGCLVLFKSKDGVREHARFHELQDRITPVAYHTFESLQACPENCQYSLKEKHYHCIWSGCTHVVPHIGPTFGRLEHYRIHEYARASQGKSYKSVNKGDDLSPRRRGRPPKYPKINIPVIPKVELTEQEIAESTRKIAIGNNGIPRVINGFKVFEENENCPDELCMYRNKQHYHCARPRCHHATDRLDVLNLHAKDFHNFVNIMEGFEFFDRNVNCRRMHCHNNKANRHFHCVKPKCDYSFVRHSTMFQHDKKHQAAGSNKNISSPVIKQEIPVSPPGFVPIVPALAQTNVDLSPKGIIKTSGTYYPLSGLPKMAQSVPSPNTVQISSVSNLPLMTNIAPIQSLPPGVSTLAVVSGVGNVVSPIALNTIISSAVASNGKANNTSAVNALVSPTGVNAVLASAPAASVITQGGATVPLTVLLQRGSNSVPQPTWGDICKKMYISVEQNCGRPFCKLKKKAHFHCYECNLAFSDPSRLRSHVGKHGIKFDDETGAKSGKIDMKTAILHATPVQVPIMSSDEDLPPSNALSDDNTEGEDELNGSSSLNLEFSTFSNMIAKAQQAHANKPGADQLDMSDSFGYGKLVIDEDEPSSLENSDVGNEDSMENSAELSVDSKNSSRKSGRKRSAPKHKDFVDTVAVKQKKTSGPTPRSTSGKDDSIPDGYIRIKQKEDCGYAKCAYRQGVTHFHCSRLDCGYSFSDRSRLIQHTLRHERIDSLTGGEMRQYRMNQACERPTCEFQGKSSHFHCLKCDYCCTDSSKVLTHRKNHAKMDSLSSQGFRKVPVDTDCGVTVCQYSRKHMHYHCTKPGCNVAVLGPSQMTAHKLKHAI